MTLLPPLPFLTTLICSILPVTLTLQAVPAVVVATACACPAPFALPTLDRFHPPCNPIAAGFAQFIRTAYLITDAGQIIHPSPHPPGCHLPCNPIAEGFAQIIRTAYLTTDAGQTIQPPSPTSLLSPSL